MKDWIKELKPGDKVAVESHYYSTVSYRIATVKKITPTGKVRLEGDTTLYTSSGRGDHDIVITSDIVQITDEIRMEIYRRNLLSKVKNIEFSVLKIEQLKQILKIVEE